ncbi:ATP-binding protein, partial [Sulfuricurvum sp.]|uniref:sacsin N-terminal ATP-binding-like domain-containing protein n=1 Tax=Sulfuricurvum sp. TaxID=2025608 RepID=UPI002630E079
MSIAELTQKRLSHVESCRLNGDNSHRIIANLYSDSTHFLYELLQNAQDAEATSVSFELHDDRLETSHNGRAFSFSDVESITTIGSSTKSNEPNKIGKFGAGFKSVFSITDTPHIYSGTYNFKISDYIIPETIDLLENQSDEHSSVVLPFDRAEIDAQTLYQSISKRLRSIGKDELLFLSNLSRIDWKIGDESGYVEKATEEASETRSLVTLETHNKSERFELYRRSFTIENKLLECKIAFALNTENRYVSIGTNPLYVFFPTVVPTSLQFLVHAPYKTTPNRETINFSDPQNEHISDNIVELYKSVLI